VPDEPPTGDDGSERLKPGGIELHPAVSKAVLKSLKSKTLSLLLYRYALETVSIAKSPQNWQDIAIYPTSSLRQSV